MSVDQRFMLRSTMMSLSILLFGAWLLYRPELGRPFDYVDFPENVLVLQANEGFSQGFRAISDVYARHGRFSPITLAAIVAQWSLFEWWTPGWHVVRFLIMSGVVVMAFSLFIKVGLTTVGALAATSLLIVSPGAVVGWTRLSTAEPLGMVWLLVACHLALRRPTAVTAILFALMLLCILWTKEAMTAAFLFPLLLAFQRHLVHETPTRTRKNQFAWLAPSALVFVLGAIPIGRFLFTSPADSFAARYGSETFRFENLAGAAITAWLPFAPFDSDSIAALLIVVFAFSLIVVIGWRQSFLSSNARRRHVLLFAIGVLVPLLGALMYTPWPFYLLVYALPFTAAGALILGQASSALLSSGAVSRSMGAAALMIVLTYSFARAFNDSHRTYALQQSFAASVTRVGAYSDIDSVLVGVDAGQFDSRGNFGIRFRLYAAMLGLQWPAVRDVICQRLPSTPPERVLVVRLNLMCEPAVQSPRPVISGYDRFAWPNPFPRRDSVVVTFTLPQRRDSLP